MFYTHIQVSVLMALPFEVSYGMREADDSRIMLTRKIIKRDEFKQNARYLDDNGMRTEGSNRANNSTTLAIVGKLMASYDRVRKRTRKYNFRTAADTKINMARSFLLLQNASMLNVTKTASGDRSNGAMANISFIDSRIENRNNRSSGQTVRDNVNKKDKLVIAFSSIEHRIHRRSIGKFFPWNRFAGRKGMNPCVKRIIKTYHSKLRRILTECKCRRATYYCSPTPGGLGRCMAVKTFYPSINKVLTTACKCK